MEKAIQGPVMGKEYRFLEDGFLCKNWDGPIAYQSVTSVTSAEGDGSFEISFVTPKGKQRSVEVILDSFAQKGTVQALLLQGVPGARVRTRTQTAWEACGTWVTTGLSLAALVLVIIAINTWGQGTTVHVPVWVLPIVMIGSFLSTPVLLAIAAVILGAFGVGAVRSLVKRKTVWVLEGNA